VAKEVSMAIGPVSRIRLTARFVVGLKPQARRQGAARRFSPHSQFALPKRAVALSRQQESNPTLLRRRYRTTAISLADARRRARSWLIKIGKGIERRQAAAKEAKGLLYRLMKLPPAFNECLSWQS
jgi:hypothetical protein